MNFTLDRLMGQVRQLIPIIGSLLVALGILTPEDSKNLTTNLMALIGPLFIVVGIVWSWIANGPTSILKSAAQMEEVKKIEVTDPKLASISNPEIVLKKE